jgi:ABC-2 type transport system permease protein
MNNIYTIARKEFTDIARSRIFIMTLGLLVTLIFVSLFVAETVFRDQVFQYEKSLALLQSLGKTPVGEVPQLYPLNLLRGVVNYIEIFGAILGIFLGYISVFKEKHTNAIKLILTRPITKNEIVFGKIFGNFSFVFALLTSVTIVIAGSLMWFSGVALSGIDIIKLCLFVVLSSVYILIFFTISFFFSFQQKIATNALIISFSIWLVFALILPQIGDTMDPDNQVPGGFFKSMALTKPQELRVMDNFKNFEFIRTGVEQLSLTKHYERAVFGFFGIKKQYNGVPLADIFKDKWGNILTTLSFLIVGLLANILYLRRTHHFFE